MNTNFGQSNIGVAALIASSCQKRTIKFKNSGKTDTSILQANDILGSFSHFNTCCHLHLMPQVEIK